MQFKTVLTVIESTLNLNAKHTIIIFTALHPVVEGVEDSDECSDDDDDKDDRQPLGIVTKKSKKKNKAMNVEADVVDVIKKDEDVSPSPVGSDDEEGDDEEDATPSDDDEEIGMIRWKINCSSMCY